MKAKTIDSFAALTFLLGVFLMILCFFIPVLRSTISYYTPSAMILLSVMMIGVSMLVDNHLDKQTSHEKVWVEVIESNLSGLKTYFVRVSIKVFGVIHERYYQKNDINEPFNWEIDDDDKAYRYNDSEDAKNFADKVARKYEVVKKVQAVTTVIYSTAKKQEAKVDTLPALDYPENFEEKRRLFSELLEKNPGGYEILEELLELHKMEQTN